MDDQPRSLKTVTVNEQEKRVMPRNMLENMKNLRKKTEPLQLQGTRKDGINIKHMN